MAKAHITTKAGTKITVEGTPKEVGIRGTTRRKDYDSTSPDTHRQKAAKRQDKQKATPINLISSLIDGGFFRKPKDLAAMKIALEEMGHFFPVTTLSPVLLRLVRKRQLRRVKDQKRWFYTG